MGRRGGPSRGCAVCRTRKIKCDETAPECLQCRYSGRECPGPIQGIFVQDMSSRVSGARRGNSSGMPRIDSKLSDFSAEEEGAAVSIGLKEKGHLYTARHDNPEGRNVGQFQSFSLSDKSQTMSSDGSSIFLNTYSHTLINAKNSAHVLKTGHKGSLGLTKGDGGDGMVLPGHVCVPADLPSIPAKHIAKEDDRLVGYTKSSFTNDTRLYCPICCTSFVSARGISNPRSLVNASVLDPFSSLPLKLDQKNQQWLYHYLHLSKQDYASWYATPSGEEIFEPITGYWLPLLLSDKTLFHGMMTCSASHKYWVLTSEGLPAQDSQVASLGYKTESCRLMNERLARRDGSLNDTSLATVICLVTAEWMSGDYERMKTHMAGLSQMVKLGGGFFKLHPILAFTIRYLDAMISMKFLQQLCYPFWNTFDAELQTNISRINATPQSENPVQNTHLRPEVTKLFSNELLDIIQDVKGIVEMLERMCQKSPDFGKYYDATNDSIALQHRLLSFEYISLVSPQSLQNPEHLISGLCRLTTLSFFGNVVMTNFYTQGLSLSYTGWQNYFPLVPPESAQLPEQVSLLYEIFTAVDFLAYMDDFGDVLLWVLFFAAFSAQDLDLQRELFVARIRDIVERMSLGEFSDVEKVLESFLYQRQVFDSTFRKIWGEVIEAAL